MRTDENTRSAFDRPWLGDVVHTKDGSKLVAVIRPDSVGFWQVQPHLAKVAHFVSVFTYTLIHNEWLWRVQVGTTKTGRTETYNPDYYCKELDCFIEVTTSIPNISEQGDKWREAIKRGLHLGVFWWEGNEITDQFGGRPVTKEGGR